MEMDKLSSFGCWVGHFPFTYLFLSFGEVFKFGAILGLG